MIDDELEHNPKLSRRELEALHGGALRWALSLTDGHRQQAEDVMQQAYLLMLEGRARFDGRSSLKTWVYAVVRNVARQERRKAGRWLSILRRQAPLEEVRTARLDGSEALAGESAADLVGMQDADFLARALEVLSARQRQVLALVIDADLTLAEVAGVLGISIGSVRTHYHRGKEQIRSWLKEQADD
jgi:RNA polymerase sigma factor (sigma-70 family)